MMKTDLYVSLTTAHYVFKMEVAIQETRTIHNQYSQNKTLSRNNVDR